MSVPNNIRSIIDEYNVSVRTGIITRMRNVLAILGGSVLGMVFFFVSDRFIPVLPVPSKIPTLQYSGIVSMHDVDKRILRISMPSAFLSSEGNGNMQFSYDDTTAWGSSEYVFENDVVTKRHIYEQRPIPLPVGTLVRVQRDPNEDVPFRASIVVFLRRTLL